MQRLFAFVGVLVAAGTFFLLLAKSPEAEVVMSDDGLVRLSGDFIAPEGLQIRATETDEGSFTAVVGSVYVFTPSNVPFAGPVTLFMSYPDEISEEETARLRIGEYDEAFGMWRPLPSEVSLERGDVRTPMDSTGTTRALLLLDPVGRPNFDAEMDQLIASAPAGAVGFEMEVGYADVPGDFVMLEGAGSAGGCAGQFQSGESTVTTSIADVFGEQLEYQIVAVWQLGEGCPEELPLE